MEISNFNSNLFILLANGKVKFSTEFLKQYWHRRYHYLYCIIVSNLRRTRDIKIYPQLGAHMPLYINHCKDRFKMDAFESSEVFVFLMIDKIENWNNFEIQFFIYYFVRTFWYWQNDTCNVTGALHWFLQNTRSCLPLHWDLHYDVR